MNPIRFFCPELKTNNEHFAVHGLGYLEPMKPGIVDRPQGTGDYLFMMFYEPVRLETPVGRDEHPSCTLMLWETGAGHYYGNPDRRWTHTWIHCEGSFVAQQTRANELTLNAAFALEDPWLFEEPIRDMIHETTSEPEPDGVILQNLFHNMMRQLGRQARRKQRSPTIPGEFLELRHRLDTEFHEPYSLDDLSAAVGLSASHFSARFREYFSMAPIAYLIQQRMYAAGYLLRNQRQSIKQIARQVGYHDEAYFSRLFRKYHGVSPREWRRRPG